ncbi:hypothetical protein RQP46_009320 [Phenoliferia psychrophenolica]
MASSVPLPPAPEPEPVGFPQSVASVRRPVGGFRGGLIGLFLGASLVGGYGYFMLLDDYKAASKTLLLSVEELKGSTASLTSHLARVTSVEDQLARLESRLDAFSPKSDLDGLRKEYRALTESQHLDLLSLKAHVWGVEQDLLKLSKQAGKQALIDHLHPIDSRARKGLALVYFMLGSLQLSAMYVGGYGYFVLLDDYKAASKTLLLSVEELQGSTASVNSSSLAHDGGPWTKLASHLARVTSVEGKLARLEARLDAFAPKSDLDGLRKEYRALKETHYLDLLSLKAHVWGVDQDLHKLSKQAGKQVRI